MMKNKKIMYVLIGLVILAVGVGVGAYAASAYGTKDDPLVAKSYIDDVLTPNLQADFNTQIDDKIKGIEQEISGVASVTSGNFQLMTLTGGQTLQGNVGCEIVLRSGTVTVSASDGLSDLTAGTVLTNGSSVSANHLCVVADGNEGVKAAGNATLLVRGIFSVV